MVVSLRADCVDDAPLALVITSQVLADKGESVSRETSCALC